jgi:adenylate cyclase
VLLLSPTSIESDNVRKEVSLAAERKKKILPLDLEPVALPHDLAYHLAGIQRTSMTNIDAIIRALGKIGLEATQAPMLKLVKETDSRRSLMILPFEDLSPTADNQWFADGIAAELISVLTNVKSLKVTDQQTTKEFKKYNGHLTVYAQEMGIRYFIQGSVRKFGDQIKIISSLLDIETGDHLWQDSLKGTMDDIFDIQEKVAEKVVEGLKVHLGSDEKKKLTTHGTENAEAYELYLRAFEYYARGTKEYSEYALKSIGHSLEIDPNFAHAKLRRAIILITYSLSYESHQEMVEEAERLLQEASITIKPQEDWRVLAIRALLADVNGDKQRAEELRKENLRLAPNDFVRLQNLAQFYMNSGSPMKVVPLVETFLKDSPANYDIAQTIMNVGWVLNDRELQVKFIREYDFLSIYMKRMRMMPDDDDALATYGLLLLYLGRTSDAMRHLDSIADSQIKSIIGCHNGACLAAQLGELERAMRWLHQLAAFDENVEFPNRIIDPELEALHQREDFQLLLEERQRRLDLNG